MSDHNKLTLSIVAFLLADAALIVAGYVHGNMHLLKTLKAAASL